MQFRQVRGFTHVGIIKKCHRIQRLCSDAALLISVIIAIVYFIVVEKNVAGWQSDYNLVVHTMMVLFTVLPFFIYGFARKSCIMITKTAVDAKLAEIREICEEAKKIHNTKAENAIFILLTQPSTYISKVINFKTKDKYTHASIAFSNDLNIVFSFSRKWVWMPLPAGFRLEHLTKSFRNKKDEAANLANKIKEYEALLKECALEISTNYTAYLGEENMSLEKIEKLIVIMGDGRASTVSEAITIMNAPQ